MCKKARRQLTGGYDCYELRLQQPQPSSILVSSD